MRWCLLPLRKLAMTLVVAVGPLLLLGGCPTPDTGQSQGGDLREIKRLGSRQERGEQFIAFLVDGTGFAEGYWGQSLETAKKVLLHVAGPGDTVSLIKIDHDTYKDANELLGPTRFSDTKLRMIPEMREFGKRIEAVAEPKDVKRGTDIQGGLHLVIDQLEKYPDHWVNLFLFSDVKEDPPPKDEEFDPKRDALPKDKLVGGLSFPPQTRLTCLFVARPSERDGGEKKYKDRTAKWVSLMQTYGIAPDRIEFRTVSESRAENLSEDYLFSLREPPG